MKRRRGMWGYFNDKELAAPLSTEQEREYGRRAFAGDEQAVEALVTHNLRFAVKIAGMYRNRGIDDDDLVSIASTGLLAAARRYNPDGYDNRFISYAVWWIKQAIKKALPEQCHVFRMPYNRLRDMTKVSKARHAIEVNSGPATYNELAAECGLSPIVVEYLCNAMSAPIRIDTPRMDDHGDEYDGNPLPADGPLPDDILHATEVRAMIDRALDLLPARSASILSLNLGLDGEAPLTLEAIGQIEGLSRERVRQLRNEAIATIAKSPRFAFMRELRGVA